MSVSYDEDSVTDVIKALQNKSDTILDNLKTAQSDGDELNEDAEDEDRRDLMLVFVSFCVNRMSLVREMACALYCQHALTL